MKYRQDIDGMRAIAVLAVVLFHFGVSTLSGGYAGVDVFFVISGFLITSILVKDIEAGKFTFLGFYEKRIRRLFPALFGVVIVSCLAGYLIFMPDEFNEFAQSMIAATTYLSNVFFWLKSDYFAGPSNLKPLLHTWSLSVEEQFYLVFPLLVWACYKVGAKFFAYTTLVVLLLSLAGALLLIPSAPSSVFFLSPFRFWELLLGSCVAIMLHHKITPNARVAPALSVAGFVMIAAPLFLLDEYSTFPGLAALPSCLGTAFIIWANNKNSVLSRFLSLNVMQFTGKISYSLYLWHWPIVVFYGYWIIRDLVWWDTILLLVITFGVSWLSWRYLETPFRMHKNKAYQPFKVYGATIATTGLVVVASTFIWKGQGLPQRFPEIKNQVTLSDTHRETKGAACFIAQDQFFDSWDFNACHFALPGAKETVLIWGDSHAFHLVAGLMQYQEQLKVNLVIYASAGCSPLLDTDIPGNPQCRKNNDYVMTLLNEHRIKSVILAGNWAWAFKKRDENSDLGAVAATFASLKNAGYKALVVNQVPLYSVTNPQFLAMRLATSEEAPSHYYLAPTYGVGAARQLEKLIPPENLFNPQKLFCRDHKCLIYKDKELMVVDSAHLSNVGSIYMVENMLGSLESLVGS